MHLPSRLAGLLFANSLFLISASAVGQVQTAEFEYIHDISPDKKFAVRISCSGEPKDSKNIDADLITAVKLVSLPSKTVVMDIPQSYSGNVPDLIWSEDSTWFAFSLDSGPRVSDTYVYHRSDQQFTELKTENLQVEVEGDVRNQYVHPIRWLKPGLLLLKQDVIFRGAPADATYQFSAGFDDKTGNFRIISKKKGPFKSRMIDHVISGRRRFEIIAGSGRSDFHSGINLQQRNPLPGELNV